MGSTFLTCCIPDNAKTPNFVLHHQFSVTMRRISIFVHFGILFAERLRGEGCFEHIHINLFDHVLSVIGGNHT